LPPHLASRHVVESALSKKLENAQTTKQRQGGWR
jgi:hypothetical protein